MKWSGSQRPANPTRTLAVIVAAGLTIFAIAGCHHKSVEDSLAAGDLAMHNTKLADAERDYMQAAAMAPMDPRPHLALGNLYVFEQKPAEAETEYEKALELAPRNAMAHTALGNVFASQSRFDLAEEQYRAAVAIDGVNPSYRIDLARLLHRRGKLGEAESQLRTAIGLNSKSARAHLELGQVLSAEPDRGTEAEAEFAQARTLDPSLFPATTPPGAAATSTAGATGSPAPEAGAAPPTPEAAAPPVKVRELRRKFLLTHDSAVYQTPQTSSTVVAQVHRGKYVNVTGIAGKWLRIRLKSGVVGYIPVKAAE
jgi:tetratricopeptide (TPR) repeat protein